MTHKEVNAPLPCADDQDDKGMLMSNVTNKRPRTQEDFFRFCTYVLEHEKYGRLLLEQDNRRTPPPLDSSGSSVNSESATSSAQEDDKHSDEDTDGDQEQENDNTSDSYDLVTCYCRKPFAGRPMIECSLCLTWVHLSCARIKRTQIPDVFYCAVCKHNKMRGEPSGSPPGSPSLKRVKRGDSM